MATNVAERGFHPALLWGIGCHDHFSRFLDVLGKDLRARWYNQTSETCLDAKCVNEDVILGAIWQIQRVVTAFRN